MCKYFVNLFSVLMLVFGIATAEKEINVVLIGPGQVGSTLIDQIEAKHDELAAKFDLDIRIVGLANHKLMYFPEHAVLLNNWRSEFNKSGEKMSVNLLVERISNSNFKNLVFVDCTSNEEIADIYAHILKAHVPIVTPNKKAASGQLKRYKILKELGRSTPFIFDPNVGAGLPIINTINEVVRSGDQVVKVEAVLSGTLSYIFNSFNQDTAFSEIVKEAQQKGYTEPDPRDDLNGMDVARKLLIIAREAGYELEMQDIQIQRFLPDECFSAPSVEEFYKKLKSYDSVMADLLMQAHAQGKRLRFIAALENGKATISLQAVSPDQAVYHLSGNDNIIAIFSKYYSKNPIVIKGPGAGNAVTAAKTLEGIVRIGLLQH